MKTGHYYIRVDKYIKISHYDEDVDKWDGIYEPETKEDILGIVDYVDVESLNRLLNGDKGTLEHLKKILPMIEYNRVAYDYLKKIIEDMEEDIKEIDNDKDTN